jgi:hypothetical protein
MSFLPYVRDKHHVLRPPPPPCVPRCWILPCRLWRTQPPCICTLASLVQMSRPPTSTPVYVQCGLQIMSRVVPTSRGQGWRTIVWGFPTTRICFGLL